MKRLVTIVVLMLGCITAGVAQDVIVTQESELIEADILEISETAVKYKKHSNPTGPTFVLSTAKISSIIYANGDVQAFNVKDEEQKKEYEPYNHLYRGIEADLTVGVNVYTTLVNATEFMGTIGIGRRFHPNFYAGLSFSFFAGDDVFPLMAVARGYMPLKNPKYEATTEVGFGYVIGSTDGMYLLSAIPGIQMPLTHWLDLRAGAGLMTAFTGYGTILMSSLNATLALHGTTDLNKKKVKRTTLNKGLQISIESGFGGIVRGGSIEDASIDAYTYLLGEGNQPSVEKLRTPILDLGNLDFSPVISYKFSPNFAVGAGLEIGGYGYRIISDAKYTLTCHDEPEKSIMLNWKADLMYNSGSLTRFFVRGEYRFSSKRFSPFASVELGFLTEKIRIGHPYGRFYSDGYKTRLFTIDIAPAVGMSLRVGSNSYISLKCQYNLALPKTLDESYSYYDNYNGTYTNERGWYCDYTEEYSYVNRTVYFSKWYIKLGFTQTLNILSDKKPVNTGKNSERVLD